MGAVLAVAVSTKATAVLVFTGVVAPLIGLGLWKLTGGTRHVTDVSNASRTMLYNLHTRQWDDDLLRLLNIPRSLLPEVRPSSAVYGEATPDKVALVAYRRRVRKAS